MNYIILEEVIYLYKRVFFFGISHTRTLLDIGLPHTLAAGWGMQEGWGFPRTPYCSTTDNHLGGRAYFKGHKDKDP